VYNNSDYPSLYSEYGSGRIIFLTRQSILKNGQYLYFLATQVDETSKVVELNSYQEWQPALLRLLMAIERQIHSVSKFITDFLDDPST